MYKLAREGGPSFRDALNQIKADPSRLARFGTKIKSEMELIEQELDEETAQDKSDLLTFVQSLGNKHISQDSLRAEICQVFERVLQATSLTDLDELLRAINVSFGDKEQEVEKGKVNIMSMHQAKGLTADATFVVAAEDEYLPGRATGEKAQDERRLLYVSLTRARHFLFITHCQKRTGAQMRTGSKSGTPGRTLTTFLRGGPMPSEGGNGYVTKIVATG